MCYLLTGVKASKANSGGKYRSEFQPRKKPKKAKNICNETAKPSVILLPSQPWNHLQKILKMILVAFIGAQLLSMERFGLKWKKKEKITRFFVEINQKISKMLSNSTMNAF